MKTLKAMSLSVAFLGLTAAVSASADTEVFTYDIPTTAVSFSDPFTLTGFETSLGTLTGITISLTTSVTAEVKVSNLDSFDNTFTSAYASVPVEVTGPGSTTVTSTATTTPFNGTAVPGVISTPAKGRRATIRSVWRLRNGSITKVHSRFPLLPSVWQEHTQARPRPLTCILADPPPRAGQLP